MATKTHFLTPCYGGQINEVCFSSYLKWVILAMENKIKFQIETLSNESNINRGRNSLVAKFLAGDATHAMFIDADIGFDPLDVVKLIGHDVDVVAGVYPQKVLPIRHVVNTLDTSKKKGNLLEVGTVGTGFMLIKRIVFERMIAELPATPYTDDIGLGEEFDDYQYDFFNCSIDSQGRYLTEDWTFCRNWRKIGGKIWADLTIDLTHTGYFQFPPNLEDLRKKYNIKKTSK